MQQTYVVHSSEPLYVKARSRKRKREDEEDPTNMERTTSELKRAKLHEREMLTSKDDIQPQEYPRKPETQSVRNEND